MGSVQRQTKANYQLVLYANDTMKKETLLSILEAWGRIVIPVASGATFVGAPNPAPVRHQPRQDEILGLGVVVQACLEVQCPGERDIQGGPYFGGLDLAGSGTQSTPLPVTVQPKQLIVEGSGISAVDADITAAIRPENTASRGETDPVVGNPVGFQDFILRIEDREGVSLATPTGAMPGVLDGTGIGIISVISDFPDLGFFGGFVVSIPQAGILTIVILGGRILRAAIVSQIDQQKAAIVFCASLVHQPGAARPKVG